MYRRLLPNCAIDMRALHSTKSVTTYSWFQSVLIRNKILSVESINHVKDLFELQKYKLVGSDELERLKAELDSARAVLESEKMLLREKRQGSIDAKTKLTNCRNTIKFYKDNKGLAGGRGALVISKDDYIHAITEEMELEAVDEASTKELLMQQSKVEEAQDKFDNLQLQKYDENQKMERVSQMRALLLLLMTPLIQFLMFRYLEPAKRQQQLKGIEETLHNEITQLREALTPTNVSNKSCSVPESADPKVMISQGTMTDEPGNTVSSNIEIVLRSAQSNAKDVDDGSASIGLLADANLVVSGVMYCACVVLWVLMK